MLPKILTVTGLALALALPAAAQSTQSPSSNSSSSSAQHSGTNSQDNTNIRQQLMQDLQKAGFTNVQVVPESFLVRAKDKQGRPVMMVVNPDSVTAITEVGGAGQSGSGNWSKSAGSKAAE
jgi:hypothetical protein